MSRAARQWRWLITACVIAGSALALSARSRDDIVGRASVLDGDTIEIHGVRIRLQGIDAPERQQLCDDHGKPWRCGRAAALALADKLEGRTLACRPIRHDRYGRTLAICSIGHEDVNAWLVLEGWALAYRAYSKAYIDEEAIAQHAHRGIWRGDFTPPWRWRAEHR